MRVRKSRQSSSFGRNLSSRKWEMSDFSLFQHSSSLIVNVNLGAYLYGNLWELFFLQLKLAMLLACVVQKSWKKSTFLHNFKNFRAISAYTTNFFQRYFVIFRHQSSDYRPIGSRTTYIEGLSLVSDKLVWFFLKSILRTYPPSVHATFCSGDPLSGQNGWTGWKPTPKAQPFGRFIYFVWSGDSGTPLATPYR